ncbi:MAG: benzoyl-CoA reductase, bzd-type, subunit [Dehalococcoidia bacterium]|nr:benzoyl-CoA reductase, bzd-type, subunit [Dehalococcoidia bacterium]
MSVAIAPKVSALDKFKEIVNNRHDYARQWKQRTGSKVLGYLCTYTAEELVYAAGILPVRIMGNREPQDVTEPYIYGMYCPYCRDCLAQGLLGRYDYLGGITDTHTCSHIRQTYDSWQKFVPVEFNHYVYMPSEVKSPKARDMFFVEMQQFKKALEDWTGKPISNAKLDRAIKVYNTNRKLLHQIYELRKQNPAPVSGEEIVYMVLASFFMDKAEHNKLLRQALTEIKQRPVSKKGKIRLITIGSENDDPALIELIESYNAQVVIDEQCTGTRYFWNEVIPQENRVMAIVQRYLDRPPCPMKDLQEVRVRPKFIMDLAREYNVQGAVLIRLKFCDPHEYDLPIIRRNLEEAGIPTLTLERDIITPVGQFKTRIGAFMEMLEMETI